MKNALLTLSAALLTCSGIYAGPAFPRTIQSDRLTSCPLPARVVENTSTRAEGTVNFTWAGDPYTAYGFNNTQSGYEVYQAFQVDPAALTSLAGNKITAVTLTNGTNGAEQGKNPDVNVTIFLSTDLGGDPFYEQPVVRSTVAWETKAYELTTPQEYDATKPLYVGYHFTLGASSAYYLPVDGKPTTAPAALCAVMTNSTTKPALANWGDYSSQMGALCMGCTFSGDNMADTFVSPLGLESAAYNSLNQAPVFSISLINLGTQKVESMVLHVEATGEEAYDINYTVTANTVISIGSPVTISATGNNFTSTGEKEIKISVTKVNGVDNAAASSTVNATTLVVEELFPRVTLFEVGTGTWCGYCPRSLVALDYIRENYQGKAIGVAYHASTQGARDSMANSYSSEWVTYMNVPGYPYAVLNRAEEAEEPYNGSIADLETQLNNSISQGSPCKAAVTGFTKGTGSKGTVTAEFTFAEDANSANYLVSLVCVEDNVGPYKQTNYYAGGRYGNLFGWEKENSSVSYIYNEVCRYLSGCPGQAISTDETLNKGQNYSVDFNVDLSLLQSDSDDPAFRAIAMITDKNTGAVLNAGDMNFGQSEVKSIMSDINKPQIVLGEGSISVSNATDIAIYTLDGVKVANGNASGLAKGVYVVKADSIVQKVMVK